MRTAGSCLLLLFCAEHIGSIQEAQQSQGDKDFIKDDITDSVKSMMSEFIKDLGNDVTVAYGYSDGDTACRLPSILEEDNQEFESTAPEVAPTSQGTFTKASTSTVTVTQQIIGQSRTTTPSGTTAETKTSDPSTVTEKLTNAALKFTKKCESNTSYEESCVNVCQGDRKGREEPVYRRVTIHPPFSQECVKVECECDDKVWTVFQRRRNGSVDFYRNWSSYVSGFGNRRSEFWLGLEWLHRFTSSDHYELRIDLEDWEGDHVYAEYRNFHIGNASTNYVLHVSDYSGDAGDSLSSFNQKDNHTGMMFSTKDRDNDNWDNSCAERYQGGWWFNECLYSHLNGKYYQNQTWEPRRGILWYTWKKHGNNYSLKATEMKFRKVDSPGPEDGMPDA